MTALALAWVLATPQVFGCPAKTPPEDRWYVQRGYGSGDAVPAKRDAIDDARSRLIDAVRAAWPAVVVKMAEAEVNTTWVEPLYNPTTRQACAIAILRKTDLGELGLNALTKDLDDALATLAGDVAARVRRAPLRIDAPTWARGPSAGELGARLVVRLEGPFTGKKVRLVTRRGKWVLGGDLTTDGARCRLQPWLQRGDARTPLAPVSFDPRAVGLSDCVAPTSDGLSDGRIGLDNGSRPSPDGLRVELTAPLERGMLCGGVPFEMEVRTNRPADVRVYSVTEDGRVMGGWEKRVSGPWRVEPAPAAVRLANGERFRDVAVAVPPGGCITRPGTFLATRALPHAAVAAFTYGVWAPGTGDCPPDPAAADLHRRLLEAIAAVPTCGAAP